MNCFVYISYESNYLLCLHFVRKQILACLRLAKIAPFYFVSFSFVLFQLCLLMDANFSSLVELWCSGKLCLMRILITLIFAIQLLTSRSSLKMSGIIFCKQIARESEHFFDDPIMGCENFLETYKCDSLDMALHLVFFAASLRWMRYCLILSDKVRLECLLYESVQFGFKVVLGPIPTIMDIKLFERPLFVSMF